MRMDKRKRYRHRKVRPYGTASKIVLTIFAICIPVTLCIAECLFNYWNLYKLISICNDEAAVYTTISNTVQSDVVSTAISNTMQLDIVNTGISVIGIAVSIWIGLNIYNNCKESELEKKLELLEVENNRLASERIKSLFLMELRKTEESYEISAYFAMKFNEEEDIPEHILEKFIMIEKDFCACCKAYEDREKDECVEYAKMVLDGLNSVKLKADTSELLALYKEIRRSDAYFYKNMSSSTKNRKELIESIKIYEKIINDLDDEKEDRRIKLLVGYLENTVGYTYLVLYRAFSGDNEADVWLEKAKDELKKAVDDNLKGRYLQNLGSYYETYANRKDKEGKDQEAVEQYENAIKQYENALISENCDNKVYNLLGSAYLKYMEKKLGIDKRFGDKDKEEKLLSDYNIEDYKQNEKEKIKEKIITAYVWLSRAITASPQLIDAYYNFGKANYYYWKFVDNNDTEKKEGAKRYINLAYQKDESNKGVLFTYRNYYEIIGNIEEAKRFNLKLEGAGDADKIQKLYDKYPNGRTRNTSKQEKACIKPKKKNRRKR